MGVWQQEIQESRGIIIVPRPDALGMRKPFMDSLFRWWTNEGVCGDEESERQRWTIFTTF